MNRKQLSYRVLAVGLMAGLAGTAAAAGAAEPDVMPNREFNRLDVNRDGYVSQQEARKVRGFDKVFKEADDNRDGRLDADEFVKAQSIRDRIRTAQYIDDTVITGKVKAALLKERALSALAVSVETYNGTVLLSGFVENENQARRATEVAAGVKGVVEVKNNLEIKS